MIASEEIASATSESDAVSLPDPVAEDLERDRAPVELPGAP